jgi:hypothetical protein
LHTFSNFSIEFLSDDGYSFYIDPVGNFSRCDSKPSGALAAQALAQRVKPHRNYFKNVTPLQTSGALLLTG